MAQPRFSLGVNYWPQRGGTAMWRAFDEGAIREEFARIASLGLDAVRFFVRWDDVQPEAERIDAHVAHRVARVVELAHEAALRALPALCGAIGERSTMPAWSDDLRDLYRGPLLDAQLQIARAIGERLRGAPNVVAWDIGHAFTRVRAPRSGKRSTGDHGSVPVAEADVAAWGRRLAATMREFGIATTAGAYDGDVVADTNVRFGSLCAPFAFASIQGSNVTLPFARSRLDPDAVPFLAMIAAAFSFKPVLVTAFGNPTCPPGLFSPYERFATGDEPPAWTVAPGDPVFAPYPCLSEDENAAYATAVLDRLHAAGRLGAYWWCWADTVDDGLAPHGDGALAPHERTCGIIRADGSEKPIAGALAAFAREARTVVEPNDMPMISSTYYYRTLPVVMRTLYDAYLAERTA